MTKSTYFLLLGLLLAAFFAAGPAQPTVAAPESNAVVGNGTPASCTEANFDAALVTAHAAGGGNISFDCGGAATIEFTSEKLITNALVTINGDGKITFSGGDKVRLFQIGKTGHLLLNDITLSHGYVGYLQGGGAILNYGSVSLDNTTIRDSHTSPGYSGGALMSQGPTTISNSLFENNSGGSAGALFLLGETVKATITGSTLQNNATSSSEYGYGGAIAAWFGADVTISDSRLLHNQARYGGALYNESKDADIVLDEGTIVAENAATLSGGGIFNSYGKLTLTGITLKDNSAAEDGGGLEVGWSGSASLTDVTLEGNTAGADGGGANSSGGAATFLRTTFIHNDAGSNGGGFSLSQLGTALLTESLMTENSANQGGGFSNSNATLTLQQSTVSHNSAVANGGGIFNKGVTTLDRSTLNENSGDPGGAIASEGILHVTNVTMSDNQGKGHGSGLSNSSEAYLTNVTVFGRNHGDSLLYNLGNGPYETIVLKNVVLDSGDFGADCETGGTEPITSAGNNLFTDDSCPYIAAGDQRFSDAKLGPLADHGGSTLTHMPLAGSPLIDRGIAVDTPSVDQRGLPRPSGAGVDIGSVERQPDDSDSFDIFLPLSIR